MKRTVLRAILGLTLLLAAGASAQAEDVPAMDFEKYTLDNGLQVILHEDHTIPTVAVNIWYHVGSKNEKPGRTGFAHLFEHLMFNGSENNNDDYFQVLERIGATTLNGTTNEDRTNYFQNVPTSALDTVLWMESDRMGHLLGAVTQEKLDEQRGVVQNVDLGAHGLAHGSKQGNVGRRGIAKVVLDGGIAGSHRPPRVPHGNPFRLRAAPPADVEVARAASPRPAKQRHHWKTRGLACNVP